MKGGYDLTIINLFETFQADEQAVEYLENKRWNGEPICPYCDSKTIYKHEGKDRIMRRWQCGDCKKSFSVTVGTIFHGTHIPLRKWFLVLALMLNAKKSASSCQISRDTGIRQPTVWSMMHRIRAAMDSDVDQAELLSGIVEADECYVGGKPRKGGSKRKKNDNDKDDKGSGCATKPKRGRGTSKTPVVGVIERNGKVVAKMTDTSGIAGKGLRRFISRFVNLDASLLITDEYKAYNSMNGLVDRAVINHSMAYSENGINTNSMESFWAIIKRSHYGTHHHYSKRYTQLYISEACYKHNNTKTVNLFSRTLGVMVGCHA